ncbi:MAG TPA: hypothetical protein H9903_09070 [Candidatus Aquabacterium excrementipullorum]|nr:hypothetical protein [Candidatus Aquabacterium excrementipullorum]
MIKLSTNLTLAAWKKSKSLAQALKSSIKGTKITPLLEALEKAAKADDYEKTLAALAALEEGARVALKNSSVDEESRDLLKLMIEDAKKLTPGLKAELDKQAKTSAKSDAKAGTPADPGTGKAIKQVVFRQDMSKDVQVSGLKHVKPPSFVFQAEIAMDEGVFKSIGKDSIYLLELNKGCQKVYNQTVAAITSKLKAFDKLIETMIDKQAPEATMQKQLDGLNKSFEEDKRVAEAACEQLAGDLWVAYCRKKTEYTKYKVKIVATIVGAGAALITSIALMATAPFTGGASAALSIIGMVKSAVTIGKEIASAAQEVEGCQKVLDKQILVVEAVVKKGTKARTANELTAIVMNEFIGISQPCIKTCQSQADTMVQKLNGVEIKSHDLSKKLNGILDAQENVRKEFLKEAAKSLNKHPSKLAPGQLKIIEKQLDSELSGNYAKVMAAIDATTATYQRFEKAQVKAVDLQKRLKALGDRSTLEKLIAGLLSLKDLPLGVLDGNALASTSQDLIKNLVPVATGWSYDRISEVALDGTFLDFKK